MRKAVAKAFGRFNRYVATAEFLGAEDVVEVATLYLEHKKMGDGGLIME
jgi:hypothetical protein